LFILAPVLKVYRCILNKIVDISSFFLVCLKKKITIYSVKKVLIYKGFLMVKKPLKYA